MSWGRKLKATNLWWCCGVKTMVTMGTSWDKNKKQLTCGGNLVKSAFLQ